MCVQSLCRTQALMGVCKETRNRACSYFNVQTDPCLERHPPPSPCVRPTVRLAQPPLAAVPCEISLHRPATCPGPPKPWIHPAWTKTHGAGCTPKRRVLWVYCVLAYISRQNILHLASDAKLFQLRENSNSPRSKYSFNFLCLEMIPRICSEWRQTKNATC